MTGGRMPDASSARLSLVVQKVIRATPARLFDAWTTPEYLKQWWGPAAVTCIAADVDLRVGGEYRIANQFSDGSVLWITGIFEVIEKPRLLIYSWRLLPTAAAERVTVRFVAQGDSTKVIVTHERIPDPSSRDSHEKGWFGCLEGLAIFVGAPAQ